jgi:hypothetical protein
MIERHTLKVRLIDLPDMHPCLLWDDLLAATAAVLEKRSADAPYQFALELWEIPAYGSGDVNLAITTAGIPAANIAKVRRTYEAPRLVELAAISLAGLALFQAGRHQIRDVSLRGTSADYLVDEEGYYLEVAGRSWKKDFDAAWELRWRRLANRSSAAFYVFVAEFETPAGRLAFGA